MSAVELPVVGGDVSQSELLARLRGVRRQGDGWMALCPAHDDHQPSLKVWQEGDEVRVHCFAGCGWQQVYAALGLQPTGPAMSEDGPSDFRDKTSGELLPIVARYEYREAAGGLCYVIGRTSPGREGAKHFPTWRPDPSAPGRWQWGLGSGAAHPRLLYRLPELIAAASSHARVYVPEGEKDVESLRALGLAATCSPHGAGSWRDEYAQSLLGVDLAVILPDNDEPGRRHGSQVAASLTRAGVPHVLVALPGLAEKGDVSDWIAAGGRRGALEALVEAALGAAEEGAQTESLSPSSGPSQLEAAQRILEEMGPASALEDLEQVLRAAAEAARSCDALQRELLREAALAAAKRAGLQRPASLVDAAFAAQAAPQSAAGSQPLLVLSDPEPWPEEVEGAALLDELAATLARFLALPGGATEAIALWALHTHCFDAFDISPRLALHSPVRRCGKTTALDLLESLVARPLVASNASTAAVFRLIDKQRPTLLLDEADTYLEHNNELRGVLNAGHRRRSAAVMRTVGESYEPRLFSAWAPVAIAKIGRLPGTLEDRSVVVAMRRRAAGESVERLSEAKLRRLAPLRRRAARWAADHLDELRAAEPHLPDLASDRARDNWRPLLAIAEACGGEWPERARRAALTLGGRDGADDGADVLLLADLRDLFDRMGGDRLRSDDVVQALATMEERPWPEWRAGRPITPQQLARELAPFGVAPKAIRFAEGTVRGYRREQFADAFARYLSPLPATGATCLHNGAFQAATGDAAVAPENLPVCSLVAGVAASGGELGGEALGIAGRAPCRSG